MVIWYRTVLPSLWYSWVAPWSIYYSFSHSTLFSALDGIYGQHDSVLGKFKQMTALVWRKKWFKVALKLCKETIVTMIILLQVSSILEHNSCTQQKLSGLGYVNLSDVSKNSYLLFCFGPEIEHVNTSKRDPDFPRC